MVLLMVETEAHRKFQFLNNNSHVPSGLPDQTNTTLENAFDGGGGLARLLRLTGRPPEDKLRRRC